MRRSSHKDAAIWRIPVINIPSRPNLEALVKLQFSNLDQLCDYIRLVESENHNTAKNWNAAQIFFHLAGAVEGSMAGLPSGYTAIVRGIIRPFRWIVTRYRFPPWMPIPASIKQNLNPPATVDFVQQKDRLLDAIELFRKFPDTHPPHPVLGSLTREQWIGFHLRHCEHHLSFIQLNA